MTRPDGTMTARPTSYKGQRRRDGREVRQKAKGKARPSHWHRGVSTGRRWTLAVLRLEQREGRSSG